MVDNKKIYEKKWKPESIQYLKKCFIDRYINALLEHILHNYFNTIYIYSIADLGCGIGLRTATLAKFFPNAQVTGFDFSKSGINVAKSVHNYDNLTFQVGDITKEDFGSFDLISVFEVLEHIDDWKSLVTSLVDRTNKYLLFSFPTGKMRKYERDGGHVRNFKKKEVETFLQTLGVKPICTLYAGFPFFSPLYRDGCRLLPNLFSRVYDDIQNHVMGKNIAWLHNITYFLARYCSTRKYLGDQFMGLFEKIK